MPTTYNFTGQRLDSQTGLLYYNFRYYDPVSGRFVRADTTQTNAGGMDPYAYVGDSPEGRTDPTGHCWPWCTALIGAAIGAVIGVAVTTVTAAVQGRAPSAGELLQAAVGGVTGAITGVLGPEAGPAARIAVGALASGVGQMAGNLVAGKPLGEGVAGAVISGAITGGIVEGAGALLKGVGSKVLSTVEEDTASHLNLGGETCSFTPQTIVASEHGEQPIGKVHGGERVLAYNPTTHQMELEPILHVWIDHDNDLVDLTLTTTPGSHGKVATQTSEVIHTNQKHPFLTLEQGFLPVGQIKLGMHIERAGGRVGVVTGWKMVAGTKVMYNLEVAQDHTFTVGVGQWVVHNCASGPVGPVNSKGDPYPQLVDPRTGDPIPFPQGDLTSVPPEDRVVWNNITRGEFIKQWFDNKYPVPAGGWDPYDIHHILPREYGGTNDFWNLVPIDRDTHQQIVTPWWNASIP